MTPEEIELYAQELEKKARKAFKKPLKKTREVYGLAKDVGATVADAAWEGAQGNNDFPGVRKRFMQRRFATQAGQNDLRGYKGTDPEGRPYEAPFLFSADRKPMSDGRFTKLMKAGSSKYSVRKALPEGVLGRVEHQNFNLPEIYLERKPRIDKSASPETQAQQKKQANEVFGGQRARTMGLVLTDLYDLDYSKSFAPGSEAYSEMQRLTVDVIEDDLKGMSENEKRTQYIGNGLALYMRDPKLARELMPNFTKAVRDIVNENEITNKTLIFSKSDSERRFG